MDVYLVPVSAERYELYCEVPDDPADAADEPNSGVLQRAVRRFKAMVAEAEKERLHGRSDGPPRGWIGRVQARVMRWVAESVAEQRLLWHLRRQQAACLFFPDDLAEADALRLLRAQLSRDFAKHRNWLAIDAVLLVFTAVLLFAVPGPNLVAYYFLFRVVGHYLSVRGARQGLEIAWSARSSAPLTELRGALALEPAVREPKLQAVAARLELEHLVSFFQRTAVSA